MTNEETIKILETIKNVYFLPMEEEGQALIKAIDALKIVSGFTWKEGEDNGS